MRGFFGLNESQAMEEFSFSPMIKALLCNLLILKLVSKTEGLVYVREHDFLFLYL